jgi:hypothetical protein
VRRLTPQELLELWERGAERSRAERAVDLLTAAGFEDCADDAAALSVGHRDDALLTLREWTFGSALHAEADCPRCGAELELDFETSDVRAGPAPASNGELAVRSGGRRIAFRSPTSADLLAAEREDGAEAARTLLLERCVMSAGGDGASALSPAAVDAVAASMADADPQADVRLALACPDCGATSILPFDVDTFFWREVEAWAQRLLHEVAALARAHGWTEDEILALSPRRRRFYLEAVGW